MKQKLQVKAPKKDQKQQSKAEPIRNEKTERQLLGELYVDKAYLEKLLKDEGLSLLYLTKYNTLFLLIQSNPCFPFILLFI